jgi:hypothetical protein
MVRSQHLESGDPSAEHQSMVVAFHLALQFDNPHLVQLRRRQAQVFRNTARAVMGKKGNGMARWPYLKVQPWT